MTEQSWNQMNLERWNRKIMNAFWISIGISTLTEVIILLFVTKRDPSAFIIYKLFQPLLLSLAVVLLCEGFYRFISHKYRPYLLVTSASLLAIILIQVHSSLEVMSMLFVLPLFVSAFFFDRNLIIYTGVFNLTAFFAMSTTNADISGYMSATEWVTAGAIITGGVFINLVVTTRGIEILNNLKEETAARQELLVQNALIDKLSKTDALTGLYNHRTFHEFLDHMLSLREQTGLQLYLALIDIDNFKNVNDRWGHRVGDLIIQRVAQCITNEITADDVAARYGGEEFAIIYTGKSFDEVLSISEKIRESVQNILHTELKGANVTVSIGLQGFEKGYTKEHWFEISDALLYKAKRNGKNRTETG